LRFQIGNRADNPPFKVFWLVMRDQSSHKCLSYPISQISICDDLKLQLETDLHSYKLNLRCFVDPQCEAEYDMELIEKVLDEREILRIQELQAMEAGANANQAEEEERQRQVDTELQQQNKAQTEAELKLQEETEFTNTIVQTLTEALARHCPKCNRGLYKDQGCNHIICPCGTHFCYLDQIDISVVQYGHFNNKPSSCPLWTDDHSQADKERQKQKAGEKAKQFATEHPGFKDLNGKLQRLLEQYLS
ncbi:MAG: hypothetical protein EZS28_039994, partial [Streblomastix strix]